MADLRRAALALGQAFQLRDDLEDMQPGGDAAGEDAGKNTLTQIIGAGPARSMLQSELQESRHALRSALGGDSDMVDLLLQRAFPEFTPADKALSIRAASARPAAAA